MPFTAEVVIDAKDHLGEAPFWDDDRNELLRVDITSGTVHGWSPSTGATWRRQYDGNVSAAIPRANGRGYVVATTHQLIVDDGVDRRILAEVETDLADNRFNHGACDPQGRLWAGTMSMLREQGRAALYRIHGTQVTKVLEQTTISNGLGWSPGGERMYFIDSTTQRLDVFDFDSATGTANNRRQFAYIDPADGLPDGLAVDQEGGIWVCLFGGAAVRRYDDSGAVDAHIALPVTNPTCPVFGGPRLRTLYITSARHRLTNGQLEAEPYAGALLALTPGTAGMRGNRFAG